MAPKSKRRRAPARAKKKAVGSQLKAKAVASQLLAPVASARKAPPSSGMIPVKVVLEIPDGMPAYYSNFIEISHTKYDFSLLAAKVPAKHNAGKISEMQATGTMVLQPDVVVSFPPALMPGLIRALTT